MRFGIEAGEHTMTLAQELSFSGVPIDGGSLLGKNGVEKTMAPIRDAGLDVCQVGMFMFNPLNADADAQQLDREEKQLRQVIMLAPEVGCRNVVIGPGNHHPSGFGHFDLLNFTEDALRRYAEVLSPLCDLAERNHVRLCVEAYLKGAVNSPRRFKKLQNFVGSPALRCNVDPSSLYDFRDLMDPEEKVLKVIEGLAGHYGVVHVKDVGIDEGFHIHMGLKPVGEGPTRWGHFLFHLRQHAAPDDWLIIEHVGSVEEGRRSHEHILDAADEVGLELK